MLNKKIFIFIIMIGLIITGIYFANSGKKSPSDMTVKEITPFSGSVKTFISCTGTVFPKNRLEIKPPVNGRIEEILVKEGDDVKTGDVLAWMSSTERAALLDAARGKGEDELKYWEEAYKPIPLISPIDGKVIVGKTQPGQTVATGDAVVVLSDRLILRAQVDEIDIGKISVNKEAVITIDAYPDIKIRASVEHIYHESKTVNNVTVYEVDLMPDKVPDFFRSGMNATVDFMDQGKESALLIPLDAVIRDKDDSYVLIKKDDTEEPVLSRVQLGISDDKNVEVISGIKESDCIVVKTKKYQIPKDTTGKNPFMPNRRR